MSDTLSALEQQRTCLLQQLSQLPDLRPGSITGTGDRCGSPTCCLKLCAHVGRFEAVRRIKVNCAWSSVVGLKT